jgi:hypothetical protein
LKCRSFSPPPFLIKGKGGGILCGSGKVTVDERWAEPNLRRAIFMSKDHQEPKKGGIFQAVKEFVYGVAAHDSARFALKTRASMEHLFILITMGDMLGVPILPPYYSLRLLPYVVPQISTWKRRMLREKDLTDALA